MTQTRLFWSDKNNAIDAAKELSNELRRTVYIYTVYYQNTTEYHLKTDNQIMDFNSPNIIHKQEYQPGKEKTINEILKQKDERVKI